MVKHILQAWLEDEGGKKDAFAHPTKLTKNTGNPALATIVEGPWNHGYLASMVVEAARVLVQILEKDPDAYPGFDECEKVLAEEGYGSVGLLLTLTAAVEDVEVEANPDGKSFTVCFRHVDYHFETPDQKWASHLSALN